jgi:sterol 3beta-glucosyltransferase
MRILVVAVGSRGAADAEVLLLQGISAIGGYHIAQGLGLPSMGLGLAPIYPTGDFPPSTLTARSLGRRGNRAAGNALVLLGSPVLAGPVKELRSELRLPPLGTWQAVFGLQDAARWPVFHGFSTAVVPHPADWRPDHAGAGPQPGPSRAGRCGWLSGSRPRSRATMY